MANQLMVIAPYWDESVRTWVFDDPATGLVREPFIEGIPEMIDLLLEEQMIAGGRKGFRLTFSALPFPGYHRKLTWVREEYGGHWYAIDEPRMEGWLCPAMFRYFETAPPELYVKAEPRGQE
jgi:hypothetical protein